MKYRIIQRGDGKYKVQMKRTFFLPWENVYCYGNDYSSYNGFGFEKNIEYEDRKMHVFSDLELAKAKIQSEIKYRKDRDDEIKQQKEKDRMLKKHKVIEVVEV